MAKLSTKFAIVMCGVAIAAFSLNANAQVLTKQDLNDTIKGLEEKVDLLEKRVLLLAANMKRGTEELTEIKELLQKQTTVILQNQAAVSNTAAPSINNKIDKNYLSPEVNDYLKSLKAGQK